MSCEDYLVLIEDKYGAQKSVEIPTRNNANHDTFQSSFV